MGDIEDYYLDLEYDPDDLQHVVFTEVLVRCKFCGRSNYHWDQDENGKWRLLTETGRLHKCSKYKPKKEIQE